MEITINDSTFDQLTDENFFLYCAKAYDKPICIMSEFEEDLKHLKYLKRLFKKYKSSRQEKDRLILNHIIILYNVFGPEAATRILFFKIDSMYWSFLKTYLLFLNYMPAIVQGIDGSSIISSDIMVDMNIAKRLRRI